MTIVPEPLTDATALWLVVSSVHPVGIAVLNAVAPKGCVAEPPDGDVLDEGVTVAAGAPHPLSRAVAAAAPAVRARVLKERRVTRRG